MATVGGTDSTGTVATPETATDPSNHFGADPDIAIVKTTNGADGLNIPVVWTYQVTTTGPGFIPAGDIEIVDDAGTPGDLGDDFSISAGDIVFSGDDDKLVGYTGNDQLDGGAGKDKLRGMAELPWGQIL